MFLNVNSLIGLISVLLQIVVVYYGWRLLRMLTHADYWTAAWKWYTVGNTLILFRRIIGFSSVYGTLTPGMKFPVQVAFEYLLQIVVSVSLFIFGMKLKQLCEKYLNGTKHIL